MFVLTRLYVFNIFTCSPLHACIHTHIQTHILAKGEIAVDPNDKRRVVITELKVNASEMSNMNQLEDDRMHEEHVTEMALADHL